MRRFRSKLHGRLLFGVTAAFALALGALVLAGCSGGEGPAGANGAAGAAGTAGAAGKAGANGKDGVAGAAGNDGVGGTAGKDGTAGTNGADGTNGTNGTNGVDGAKGEKGETGASGVDYAKLNLGAVHNSASVRYDADCLKCHAGILKRQSMNPAFAEVHVKMIPFVPGYDAVKGVQNRDCTWCHMKVDFSLNRSAGNIRRQVDMTKCSMCHSPAGPGKPFYQ